MEIELLEEPTTALTVTARAALALSSEQTRKGMSFNDALNRLAEVQEWIAVEVAA